MYEIQDILGELTNQKGLPRAALKAASERRSELVGPLLAAIESSIATQDEAEKPNLIFFAFHLLGEWRERTAYRTLAKLLRQDRDWLDPIFDDAITMTTHRVMAAVYDGDPQPLYEIILDDNADQFVRSRMCELLAMLAVDKRLDRAEAGRFLRDAFPLLKSCRGTFVWSGWQETVAMLGAAELSSMVKQAFDEEFVHPGDTEYAYFEEDLAYARAHPDKPWQRGSDNEYELWGDTIAEFSTWYAFSDQHLADRARRETPIWEQSSRDVARALNLTYVNPLKRVGRNDPCPCGSGLKHKKCCLA